MPQRINNLNDPLLDEEAVKSKDDKNQHTSVGRVLSLAGPETCLLCIGVVMLIGSSR